MRKEVNNWQQINQRYLSAALAWLRLCLRRVAQQPVAPAAPISTEPVEQQQAAGRKWHFWDKSEPSANQPRALLLRAPDNLVVTADHQRLARLRTNRQFLKRPELPGRSSLDSVVGDAAAFGPFGSRITFITTARGPGNSRSFAARSSGFHTGYSTHRVRRRKQTAYCSTGGGSARPAAVSLAG